MKHAKKLVAMLLLLCLAVPMFAACGKAGDDTTAANTSENQDSGSQDMSNVVEVPEVTFDGYEFTFLTGSNVSTGQYGGRRCGLYRDIKGVGVKRCYL